MTHTVQNIRKKTLLVSLFAIFLPLSTAWAMPGRNRYGAKNDAKLKDQHMLNVDLGIGLPPGWLLSSALSGSSIKARPSFVFGASYGYLLPNGSRIQFAPEVGTKFCFSKYFGWHGHTFREPTLQVPILANMRINYPDTNLVIRQYIGLGFELDTALSSYSTRRGGDRRNLLNDLPGFSRFSGSIIINWRSVFQKGIFINTKMKIPFKAFSIISDLDRIRNLVNGDVDEESARILRVFGTSLVEISLGLDIMELL